MRNDSLGGYFKEELFEIDKEDTNKTRKGKYRNIKSALHKLDANINYNETGYFEKAALLIVKSMLDPESTIKEIKDLLDEIKPTVEKPSSKWNILKSTLMQAQMNKDKMGAMEA
tara:strand:- start:4979 stop:5320 length:342 start_codon:yes stop_codon:yes gene_type:complete